MRGRQGYRGHHRSGSETEVNRTNEHHFRVDFAGKMLRGTTRLDGREYMQLQVMLDVRKKSCPLHCLVRRGRERPQSRKGQHQQHDSGNGIE